MTAKERADAKKARAASRLITCMEFTPTDGELLVGLSSGTIKVITEMKNMEGEQYKERKLQEELTVSEKPSQIKQLVVSADGKYFATSDHRNCVSLFIKDHFKEDETAEIDWYFVAKLLSHQIEVTSICFG